MFRVPLASSGMNATEGCISIFGAVWAGGQRRYEIQVREMSDIIIVRKKRWDRIIERSSYG